MNDEFYMQLAIDKAWEYQGLTYPNPAVGAVVTHHGQIVSIEAHQRAGTSHAEVLALVRAYEAILEDVVDFDLMDAMAAHDFLRSLPEGFFAECSIYVTLEPCAHEGRTPSCASLLAHLRLARVVIGTLDPLPGHGGGAQIAGRGVPTPTVTMGVAEEACRDLIEPFLIWQERAFVLLKLAQTHNGRITGGIISSEASRTHVHRLRGVCDTLLIGGNTVRADRPILDSRLSGDRAPDAVIYSRSDEADQTISLFDVAGRNVRITDDLSWLDRPGFVLVEGGGGMLRALVGRVDWMLTYQAPKLASEQLPYNTATNLQYLHTTEVGGDLMIWSRNLGNRKTD
jgi:diaminohydroxyphosphoribosylaminopyrimidine deaminase/5-amino-6-(5-phosphoribosylamino)uracil reductase